ncbi:MAG: hypothetical protein KAI03_01700 [Candidatus Aureabacteria bacterium]|nr:hypothetical protein [Candidatus Auribacterota bacterium]
MENWPLIDGLKRLKEDRGYTLYDLSKKLDMQITTIERWLKTGRINRIYAKLVKDKLNL